MAISPLNQNPPLPPNLKPPHSQTPWRISPTLFGRISQQPPSDTYKKQELSPTDPEYTFVHHYFNHQKPTNRSIATIYCIHNPSEATVFENKLPSLETEASNPFFQSQWTTEPLSQLRQKVIDRFKTIASSFSPFEVQFSNQRKQTFTHTHVIPLWHGSTKDKCHSICRSGFTFFGKHGSSGGLQDSTDIGFFGSGIYFTTSARYAADTYSDKENLLLGWVSMREPFPVISDTSNPSQSTDMKRLKGQGAYQKYNAHYIPVVPDPHNPESANYYPCPVGQQPVWDEIVVFQQSQTLVRFWVVLQVDLTKSVPGSTLTVGALLKIVGDCLDQNKVQQHQQLSHLLETKETELVALNPSQTLTETDTIFFNYMHQLLDENKNVRDRIAKKLLSSTTASSPSTTHISSPIATSLLSNPVPGFSQLTMTPPSTSTPPYNPPFHGSFPSVVSTPSPVLKLAPTLPAIAFGVSKWNHYIGDVGAEPPLPPDIHTLLSSPCPFWPSKKVYETHLLVLIPQTINGKLLNLKSLGELVNAPRQGNKTQYQYFYLGKYTDISAPASHWVLMTRDVIEGSRDESYAKQYNLISQHAQKSGQPYQVPTVLDATVCIFMEYIQTGKRLYGDSPRTYTRCQEQFDKDSQLAVGGFSSAGLCVLNFSYCAGAYVGVCGLRKF